MFWYLKISTFYIIDYNERGKKSRKIVRTQETGAGSEVEKDRIFFICLSLAWGRSTSRIVLRTISGICNGMTPGYWPLVHQ